MHQCFVDLIYLVVGIHLSNRTGPSTGLRRFRVITLAGPEFEIIQPDQSRPGTESVRLAQGLIEQMVGARETRVACIHRRRGDAGEAEWPCFARDLAR